MYISGPMDSKPDFRLGDLGSFPRRGGYVFALQFFLRVLIKKVPCFHAWTLVTLWEWKLLLMTLGKTRNLPQIPQILTFCLAEGFDLALSLGVTTPRLTPVMGISWPCGFGKVCFDMLKSIGFGDKVRLFSSLRQSDRVYLSWFVWDLVGKLFQMWASRRPVKIH